MHIPEKNITPNQQQLHDNKVAKDEDIDLNLIVQRVANGSIIIPKNNIRKQKKIKVVGIGAH